jgi:hypothetical protein
VSCLDFAQGTLWGCTPGLATQDTLVAWNDEGQAFDGVVALASVTRLADCSPETDVATKCAAAWAEWRRDILMLPPAPEDAGGTGGFPSVPPQPTEPDAGDPAPSPDGSTSAAGRQSSSSGCSITTSRSGAAHRALALGAVCLAAITGRYRRKKSLR